MARVHDTGVLFGTAPGADVEDPKAFAATVGEAVRRRKHRQACGWTQAQPAEAAGLFGELHRASRAGGARAVPLRGANQLCSTLRIPVSDADPARERGEDDAAAGSRASVSTSRCAGAQAIHSRPQARRGGVAGRSSTWSFPCAHPTSARGPCLAKGAAHSENGDPGRRGRWRRQEQRRSRHRPRRPVSAEGGELASELEDAADDDQPGHPRQRRPELPAHRPSGTRAPRGLRSSREDHPLRPRADPRAHRPTRAARRPRVLRASDVSLARYTRADFLCRPGQRTPVFARFSTVAGGAGSGDLPRDVRGFAVKFYTREGNFDLVGNNIPVFFIQDAIKFPDLIHSVKMEPDRGFPQAASAHDTFWDFMSLMPESTHMILWAMSDRAIPRSLRMMGRGSASTRFASSTPRGASTFVKFHWRPRLSASSSVRQGRGGEDQRRRPRLPPARHVGRDLRRQLPGVGLQCLQLFTE